MTTVQAGQFVSSSLGIMSTTPVIGAIIADTFLGNYLTMVTFLLGAFLPGLLLYALMAYPFLLGATLTTGVLIAGMKGLYPLGSGALRACGNIFRAQQFHPVLQKKQIESYYLYFYLLNCIASLVGGMVIPVVLNYNAFVGYMILTCCAELVLIVFF
jgi:hypothetical protein